MDAKNKPSWRDKKPEEVDVREETVSFEVDNKFRRGSEFFLESAGRRTSLSFKAPSSIKKGPAAHLEEDESEDSDEYDLSIDQILALKEQFDAADIDGGGSLDIDEFTDAFEAVFKTSGRGMEDLQVERLFMQIDANSDGQVDWGEFSEYMLMESQANQTEAAGHVFHSSLTSVGVQANFFVTDCVGDRTEAQWHITATTCILVDNHGGHYVTAAKDRTIRLWVGSSLNLLKTIHCPDWIHAMCIIPGLARLCTASADRRIRLYDIHTWEIVREVELPDPAVCLCTWKHKEDEMLAYGDDKGKVTVVNLSRGFDKPKAIRNESDQNRLVSWVESSTKIVHDGWVNQIAMIQDLGCLVSCGSDSAIIIFEYPLRSDPDDKDRITPKRTLKHVAGHTKGVKCFEWMKTQKVIASGGLERAIVLWNPYTGKPITSLVGHQIGIEALAFIPEFDKMISIATDHVVKIWDVVHNECVQTIPTLDIHSKPTAMLYDPSRHRLIGSGRHPSAWKIHPRVLLPRTETTHSSAIVGVLFNRLHGQLVTIAEDSETCIWRIMNGRRIFSYFDTERDEDAPISCATYDEAGRRMMTGDHQGKVRVWNFNNGGCLKVLKKPKDKDRRQEITDIACYSNMHGDKRFIAATSWDRRVSIWLDDMDASSNPLMRVEGHESDIISIVFAYPKNLITTATDGTIFVFDIDSGVKKSSLQYPLLEGQTRSPLLGHASVPPEMINSQYVERIIVLTEKGRTLVSVGTDANLCFWDGVTFRLMLFMSARHLRRVGLVDVQSDKLNKYLVTGDQAGYIKIWDIKDYNCKKPNENQVKAICFWQAHSRTISSLDIVPYPKSNDSSTDQMAGTISSNYVLVTGSVDRRALVWSFDGMLVGQLGQGAEWNLDDISTWQSNKSASILGSESAEEEPVQYLEDNQECEEQTDILALLDERLRIKAQGPVGSPAVPISEIPESFKKTKRKDYSVDPFTGERIFKNNERKNMIAEEKRKMMSPYLKSFVKKIDPDNMI